jgi:hypothetical protein
MRHSDFDLTMNVYTDPRLLDVRGAFDVLPALQLDSEQGASSEALRATGTDTYGRCSIAPLVALTDDNGANRWSSVAKQAFLVSRALTLALSP